MKKIYLLSALLGFGWAAQSQVINIPDPHLKEALYAKINDTNHNNEIDLNEAQQLVELNLYCDLVTTYEGIQYFSNLELLYLWNNNQYSHTDVDIRGLTHLHNFLYSSGNQTATVLLSGLANLTDLYIRGAQMTSLDLTGLTSLQSLSLTQGGLTSLDISPVQNLAFLTLLDNPITFINLNGNPNLQNVWISGSLMTAVDVSGLPLLTSLNVGNNRLTSLNLAGASQLNSFICSENLLTSVDVSANPLLWSFDCSKNQLTNLDLSHNTLLGSFSCSENQLTDLDLSHSKFRNIFCASNNLVTLNLKNNNYDCEVIYGGHGQISGRLVFSGNPNLQYICLDPSEETYVQSKIAQYGYANCHVNGYCSFNPGGIFYTVNGQVKYDAASDGCDQNDALFSHLNLAIADGTTSGNIIADASGNYSIPLQAGNYTIAPVLENPNYFTVSPANVTITFPDQASPLQQNFCIVPNGIHKDAEVSIVPINAAMPGFEAKYKILYKNKGTQPLSGSVSFAYNAAVLDFVGASISPSSQPMNYINWDFTNLQPFEVKEIVATFVLNTPTQTPPVNAGFVLTYTLCINTGANEETPADNVFVLNQTVVNSMDPNEKVCLEGNHITPEMIGKDVHYVIRFENTGNANARNVVIKDVIDTTKFEISSLTPMQGSHPFTTKISNTNQVEFIFENINLPFDDANNDGYVMFKIKTKPTLTLGDSFSNSASIYFDYNAPIDTDAAVTSVQLLANEGFTSEVFSIAPNPATTAIQLTNLTGDFAVQIASLLGQVVFQKSNANNIDVSDLAQGVYLITVKKGSQSITQKFIKN